jgi:hypothetical protein
VGWRSASVAPLACGLALCPAPKREPGSRAVSLPHWELLGYMRCHILSGGGGLEGRAGAIAMTWIGG